MVLAGLVLTYALVAFYVLSALISKKRRTPYDWAAGSWVIAADQVHRTRIRACEPTSLGEPGSEVHGRRAGTWTKVERASAICRYLTI